MIAAAVTALLLAILLSVLSRARQQARAAACGINLRTCGQALAYYLQANDDAMCWGGDRYTLNAWERLHVYVQKSAPTPFADWDRAPLLRLEAQQNPAPLVYAISFYLCPGDAWYHHTSQDDPRYGRGVLYPLSYCTNDFLFMVGRRPDGMPNGPRKASSIPDRRIWSWPPSRATTRTPKPAVGS